MIRTVLSLLFISMIASPARAAAPSGNDLVKTELIAEVESVKAGRPFLVGVHFTIEPHWHIYWTNPGDAGTPTELKFDLPPGWTATDIQYPVPERFTAAGDIVSYGYQNETMLVATITPPRDLKPGEQVKIIANAEWLVCDKICLPGKGSAELTLPVKDAKRDRKNEGLIKDWWFRTPRPASQAGAGVSYGQDKNSDDCLILISWPQDAPKNVEWFPSASNALAFTNIRVSNSGKQSVIRYKMQPVGTEAVPEKIPASVVVYDAADARRGVIVPEFPVPHR